ncbi:hypothetical protein I0C86_07000 [Plantactinospora sp. S1510]|uniref:Integral membrane protein n=1 Tax=Plantactinospora alkalitolerans TaxID=2789879 RepID=A0ABS0GRA7_9ACTN|nr:hypothetical protein [Plantactinospora alkalitolerans]MBF9128735.1 hypothetical protein [Plantactinospora alkalitolerans]
MTMLTRPERHRRADLIVLATEAALLAAAIALGALLNRHGVRLYADAAPLYATWRPHLGFGTPAALLVAALVIWRGAGWAATARWPRLLAVGYLGTLAWTLSLALVDGWSAGLTGRLTVQAEYLHEVPRVTDIQAMLSGFADRILDFQPDSWSTHTAGHPPGALLLFVWLDRIGLGGGTAAGLACVLLGATVSVSVPVTLRALGAQDAARTVWPFLVLFPGAVWVGASADGIFAAVVAAGLALLVVGGRVPAALGGLLLGFALYLSYGFVLVGLLALTVVLLRARDRLGVLVVAVVAVGAVVVSFTLAGFHWLDGYHLVVRRYYQGWAAQRPYGYWVWANLAALLLSAGPVVGPAIRRTIALVPVRPSGHRPAAHRTWYIGPEGTGARRWQPIPGLRRLGSGRPAVWLPLAAVTVVLAADLSALSKAEVERIWLPFAVWLLVATAHLPAGQRRWWLALQAATALAVNHLLWTVS